VPGDFLVTTSSTFSVVRTKDLLSPVLGMAATFLFKIETGPLTEGVESDSIRLLAQPFPLARPLG
jgi:hypothetical protein